MERKASIARSHLEQMLVDESAEPKALPLSLLEDITGDFSEDQKIGRGGFAVVYKGILGNRAVAVKKLCDNLMDETKFHREVECLMRVKHKNVVRFLGYCADRQGNMAWYDGKLVMADVHQRLLCFEYIPKGSLDKYIKDAHREWGTCYKIIKGVCEGLQYLHENHIIHLDLKPANILLDDNMVPKITDFGLSRCFDENQSRHITKTILGTMGYLAPELLEEGVIARSADLYSLGVIIIEILTGQKGPQATDYVLESWSDRFERSQRDTLCEQIRVCYEIALECTNFNPKKRPASANIIDRLHEMGSNQTAEDASSTSGVVVAATESKGKSKDALDDRQDVFTAAPSDPVASTSRAPVAESKGKSKDEPRVFHSVSASSGPRHATLHAMAAPHPAGPAPVQTGPGSAYSLVETKPPLPARLGPRGAGMAATTMSSTYDMVEPMAYLYVSVVKAYRLPTVDFTGALDPYVEVKLGNFRGVTRHVEKTHNPVWRQKFALSFAHLHSNQLEVIVKDKGTLRDDFVGRVVFDMSDIPCRYPPDSPLAPQWYNLSDAHGERFLHGHSLLGEIMQPADYISDLQPAAEKLRKSSIGVLAVGILGARGLGGNKNPYCVAKYGAKWVRTRTLLGTAAPQWNEQYNWEVFDLSTVITVAVFDNKNLYCHGDAKDERIGKVRVRLATLESDRVYTHYYPLMALSPGGLNKTGELHLAVRFTCTAWANMLAQYGRPLLPKMHYTNPISVLQLDYLRFESMVIVATWLGRAEPPLRREVVEYMLDVDSKMFSLRRNKANICRITMFFSGVVAITKWFDAVCKWKNPLTTILVHVVFLKVVCYPRLILPTVFLCFIMIVAWNYRRRLRKLPHMDAVLSHTELAHPDELDVEFDTFPNKDAVLWWYRDQTYPDELDEEFDTFPTSKPDDIVRLRYERLRGIASTVQTVMGDLAAQGERAQFLLRWYDPRATPIFLTLLLMVAVVLYLTPFRVVTMVMGLYFLRPPFLRPPWFRGSTNPLCNFYSRLPSNDDLLL